MVLPAIERHGPIAAWIIDDTSFPKQGRHSVGVAHQYCGQLGKQANCQVAVSLSMANHHASLPVAYRLYLTKDWGPRIPVGTKRVFRQRSASRPSRRSRSSRFGGHVRSACRAARRCSTPAMVTTASCARASVNSTCPMWLAFSLRPWCGHRARGRAAPEKGPPRSAQCGLGQGGCSWASGESVAHDQVAGRHERMAILTFCTCACLRRIEQRTPQEADQRVAADRVAGGRGRANQVLALDPCDKHPVPRSGRCRQTALAHRARLSGAQAGSRAFGFRRAWMARFPPSCHALHCGLRIPGLRTGDDSPLRTSFRRAVPATCRIRRLPTRPRSGSV